MKSLSGGICTEGLLSDRINSRKFVVRKDPVKHSSTHFAKSAPSHVWWNLSADSNMKEYSFPQFTP
eukprot:c49463_g1_i1 orf=164-361(+)